MSRYQVIKWDEYYPNNKVFPDNKRKLGYSDGAIICGPHAVERSIEYLSTRKERLGELESIILETE